MSQESPLHGLVQAVQVVGAAESSAGWRAGIRPGDVIVSANKTPVKDIKSLQTIAQQKKQQLFNELQMHQFGLFYLLVR